MTITPRLKIILAQYSPYAALLAAVAVFSVLSPRFATLSNSEVILLNIAEMGILVIPMALLIMSGTVDLSVGSIASLGAVISAWTMTSTGLVWAGILAGVLFGSLAGAINGLLVSVLGLNPIVITLGFLSVWGGLALYLTGGTTIAGLPAEFTGMARFSLGPVPVQLVLLVVVVAGGWFILNKRPLGREILAIGGSKRAAYLIGIDVRRTQFLLFTITGAAAGLAGILLSGKLAAAPPTIGLSLEMSALLVILVGGVAFEGGSGRISGVVAGLLLIGVLNNGLIVAGVSQFLQSMIIGLTLVLAVCLDRSIGRSVRSAWAKIGSRAAIDPPASVEQVAESTTHVASGR